MPARLPLRVRSLDEVPADKRFAYRPATPDDLGDGDEPFAEGEHVFDFGRVEDVTNLKSAHERQKSETQAAKDAARAARDEADRLKREREAQSQGISQEVLDRMRDEDRRAREAEVAPLTAKITDLESRLRTYEIEEPVRALLGVGEPGGLWRTEWADKATRAALVARFTRSDAGTLVVLDEKGEPTTKTPEQFVAEYRREYGHRFDGAAGSGGGAERTTGGAPVTKSAREAADARLAREPYRMV